MDREQLEVQKLQAEIALLRQPVYKTPTFWIAVVAAVIAILGTIGQSYLSRIEIANALYEMNGQIATANADIEITNKAARELFSSTKQAVDAAAIHVASARLESE